jgi:CRP-like cAMP-binding protein
MALVTVERVAALHHTDLFRDVPGRTLAAVARLATEVEIEPGGRIIEEGSVEDHLFVIVRGRVWVHQGDRTLRELGPGATIGELAALVPEPRSASVTALEPTLLLRTDKPVLDELLADHPALAGGVITALVGMLRTAGDR